MAEVIFQMTKTTIYIHTNRRENVDFAKAVKTIHGLVVDTNGSTFRDALGRVKKAFKDNPARAAIRSLRSTREGKLLITINKDPRALAEVKDTIKKDNLKIREIGARGRREIAYIRFMDIETTKEDIKNALQGLSLWEEGADDISELRPYSNDTKTATIILNQEKMRKLVEMGEIRIGMVLCPVEKKIKIEKCRKCWSFDHKTSRCEGEDRSRNCFKCGKEGHSGKECGSEEACPVCKVEGHRTGAMQCPAFRQALARAREYRRHRRTTTVGSEGGYN